LSKEDVPAEEIEKERAIVTEISRNEGKPEAQLEKIVDGRINAYVKQIALLEQEYARDNKFKVSQVLSDAGVTVTGFSRFKVGA
jgi:elongation factor Ts